MSKVNLLEVLNYYLIMVFVVGSALRLRNYRIIVGLIFKCSRRWPRLLVLAKEHKAVFLRWPMLVPIGMTLTLMLANTLARYLVRYEAAISFAELWLRWLPFLIVTLSGGAMCALDCRAVFGLGQVDRPKLEKDLDNAEQWLRSWKAPLVRFFTLGLINPRKIVNTRVLDALTKASLLVNGSLWRWVLQMVMRVTFGFSLWITALSGPG